MQQPAKSLHFRRLSAMTTHDRGKTFNSRCLDPAKAGTTWADTDCQKVFFVRDQAQKQRRARRSLPASTTTVEAIVRMAYRVAESQSERSQRLAQRLSCGSGDADTVWNEIEDQAREVLKVGTDAAAVNLAALKQLVQSECKVLQALLSLLGIDSCGGNDGTQMPKVSPVRIVHVADTADRRAVLVQAWRLHGEPPDGTRLHFIHVEHPSDPRIEAELSLAEMGPPRLALRTPAEARSGLWRSPICDSNDVQVGIIDILL